MIRTASTHRATGAPRRAILGLVVVAALAAPGCCRCCQRWNWRGDGFGDEGGSWAQKMRPPADQKNFSGLDARSREIERDLGVR
jgi:hypothetical protein